MPEFGFSLTCIFPYKGRITETIQCQKVYWPESYYYLLDLYSHDKGRWVKYAGIVMNLGLLMNFVFNFNP